MSPSIALPCFTPNLYLQIKSQCYAAPSIFPYHILITIDSIKEPLCMGVDMIFKVRVLGDMCIHSTRKFLPYCIQNLKIRIKISNLLL